MKTIASPEDPDSNHKKGANNETSQMSENTLGNNDPDVSECQSPDDPNFNFTGLGQIAPAPLEPEDLTAFALTEEFHSGVAKKALTTVLVKKPSKESFVRTHTDPKCWQTFALLELREDGKFYLPTPRVAAALQAEGETTLIRAQLVLSVDRRGTPFLWPLKISDRELGWYISARRAASRAKSEWLRVRSNMSAEAYDVFIAKNQKLDPVWPEEDYGTLLRIAFEGRVISDMEHPVLKELRGQF